MRFHLVASRVDHGTVRRDRVFEMLPPVFGRVLGNARVRKVEDDEIETRFFTHQL